MATTGNAPDHQHWLELARVIESLTGQVQTLADSGGRKSQRVAGLALTTRQLQDAVAGLAHRHRAGAGSASEHQESNSLVLKRKVQEGPTHKVGIKQESRRCKLVAGAEDERFKVLLEWELAQGQQ